MGQPLRITRDFPTDVEPTRKIRCLLLSAGYVLVTGQPAGNRQTKRRADGPFALVCVIAYILGPRPRNEVGMM